MNILKKRVKEYVKEYINSCLIYNSAKHPCSKKGYMAINPWPYHSLEVISTDNIVELPKTLRGYNHLLVINSHFSKYIKLYVIKDRTAKTAAKYVTDYFLDYGIPLKLLSDQDPSYESELFQQAIKNVRIKKIRTSDYRPSTNGLTEQSNTTTRNYLTTLLDSHEQKNGWNLLLNLLCYAYNFSVHTSTETHLKSYFLVENFDYQ